MKIGSLFSGYGGLELGVQSVLGGETVWHSEIDPGACKILAHHWPDVPIPRDTAQDRGGLPGVARRPLGRGSLRRRRLDEPQAGHGRRGRR